MSHCRDGRCAMRREDAIRRAEQWLRGRETHSLSDIADLVAAVHREATVAATERVAACLNRMRAEGGR